METFRKVAFLMVLCTVIMAPHAEAAITCGYVVSKLKPCIPYLKNGGQVPASCCNGVKGLNAAAKTTPDRQATCRCLISASKSIPGIKPENANKLPGICGVSIPYKISPTTDCNKVQ